MAKGEGYRAVNYPQEPFFYHHPPVFAFFLSPLIYLWGRNFYIMHILVAFLGYLSLYFIYLLFKKYTNSREAFLITFIFATNNLFIIYSSHYILSDIPYLFITSLTFLFIYKYLELDNFLNKEGLFALCGIILSYFTRYIGIAIFFSTLIVLLCLNKIKFKRFLFISIGFLIPFLLWQFVGKKLNPSSVPSYFNNFFLVDPYRPFLGTIFDNPKFIFTRIIEGINYYYGIIGNTIFFYFTTKGTVLKESFSSISMGLMLWGLWLTFRQSKTCIFVYYFLVYFFLIVLWPFKEGERFILPILPFIYFYCFIALKEIFKFLPQKRIYFPFYIFFIFNIIVIPLKSYSQNDLPKVYKNFISLHKWIKENLSQGIIISRKPAITYFLTEHQSIVYPYTLDYSEIWQELVKNKVKYIIIDEFSLESQQYLMPFLKNYKNEINLVYRIGNTGLFELKYK